MTDKITKCPNCEGNRFYIVAKTIVYFKSDENGILEYYDEQKVGLEDVVVCEGCDKEFTQDDFKEIV